MEPRPLSLADKAQRLLLRSMMALPERLQLLLSGGRHIELDGQTLNSDTQLLIRLTQLAGERSFDNMTVAEVREQMDSGVAVVSGPPIQMEAVRELVIPGPAGHIPARFYVPPGCEDGGGLLVYYHGGGWVIGGLDSHDSPCRFLASEAGVKVLSIDYRLAPEHPFPAACDDALAAFRWAVEHADSLAVDPARIAVAGDSAGGNLAAAVSLRATRDDGPAPAFQMPIYPVTDLANRTESYRLFAEGFFLTADQMDWFIDHYSASNRENAENPSASPLLAEDLSGLPPAYVTTAGFDPLRDEGEAYAERLKEAGVPVTLKRHEGLVHGFANTTWISEGSRSAMAEAAAALSAAIG